MDKSWLKWTEMREIELKNGQIEHNEETDVSNRQNWPKWIKIDHIRPISAKIDNNRLDK